VAHSRREFLKTTSAAAAVLGQAACGAAQRPVEETLILTPAPSTDNAANRTGDPSFPELALLALDAGVRFQRMPNVSLHHGGQDIDWDDVTADVERGIASVALPIGIRDFTFTGLSDAI
jgi:hypothetical protein